jgi:crossover junction endodeoxyribonuclease RuvC
MEYILGIDPGSRITGYGIIALSDSKIKYIESGVFNIAKFEFYDRLKNIFLSIQQLLSEYKITQAAIESVFVAKNVNSALKLGQARGAALAALAMQDIKIAEYAPRVIKKSVVGYGNAEKEQVQLMIRHLLGLNFHPKPDAADALAVAICHTNSVIIQEKI